LSYLGWIDRQAINNLFARSLAVVVPSIWQEPGGLVALEAMAVGTPLVAYDAGGLSEYVANAGAGVVVQPRSDELAAACDALVGDAHAWRRFSASGISAAKGCHSVNTHCETVEHVFADAAGGGQ
jgi:glycosyltransferase involved in cell wall biosynthesis